MSNLFTRPRPSTATPQDVLHALDEITSWDWETGYSFAHVVIGDQNLGDGSILYCLRPSWIAEVMNQRLLDDFGFQPDFDKLEIWQWEIYRRAIQHMAEVIDLLNWLLEVDKDVQDEAEALYRAWENA